MIGMRCVAKVLAAALALALALVPGAALAKGEALHRFTVGGKAFTVPVPEGYCLPSDATIALAEKVASLDSLNLTHANLDRCGTFGEDYVHIKSPRKSQPLPIPRADFLALVAREFQATSGQQLIDDAVETAGRDVAKGTNNEVQIDNAVPRFIGQDDMCVYLAITSDVTGPTGSVTMNGVVCITVIGGEVMNVNAYAISPTGITEAQLKTRVLTIATLIASTSQTARH